MSSCALTAFHVVHCTFSSFTHTKPEHESMWKSMDTVIACWYHGARVHVALLFFFLFIFSAYFIQQNVLRWIATMVSDHCTMSLTEVERKTISNLRHTPLASLWKWRQCNKVPVSMWKTENDDEDCESRTQQCETRGKNENPTDFDLF